MIGGVVADLADCWFRRIELSHRWSVDQRALRLELAPAPLTEAPSPAVLERLGGTLSRLAAGLEPSPAQQEQALLLEALIGAVALRSMQAIIAPGRPFTVGELTERGAVAVGVRGFAESLLRLLERFGAASEIDGEWQLEEAGALPEIDEVWRSLLADAPDLVAELALTALAAGDLAQVLGGRPEEDETALSPMAEHLLQGSPASIAEIGIVCDALHQLAASWPKGRPLRILELGATGGGATRRILDQLAQSGVAISYLATSGEAEQAARLSFLTEAYTGASARQWSPRDGFKILEGASFDIVLAVNAGARLQLDGISLAGLRDVLAPGGLFVAAEPEPHGLWDMVFGQRLAWWRAGRHAGETSPHALGR